MHGCFTCHVPHPNEHFRALSSLLPKLQLRQPGQRQPKWRWLRAKRKCRWWRWVLFWLSVTKGFKTFNPPGLLRPLIWFFQYHQGGGIMFWGVEKNRGAFRKTARGGWKKKADYQWKWPRFVKKAQWRRGCLKVFPFVLCLSHQKVEMLGIPFKISGTSKKTFFVGWNGV